MLALESSFGTSTMVEQRSDNSSQERHHVIYGINGIITFLEHCIVETDMVIHTMKTDKVKQIVDVKSSGKSADEIDKETVSFGEMQLKQEDRSCVHASTNFIWLDVVIVVQVSMKSDHISSMQVFNQLNISNEFAPFSRKVYSEKLGIDLICSSVIL
ncbi:hypothetical protein Tco_0944033 [Tanacetum coccineum]